MIVPARAYARYVDASQGPATSCLEWDAALELADRVEAGADLPNLASPVLLDAGELVHADLPAQGWRYHAVDVTYSVPQTVAIGGPLTVALAAATNAAARRRTRREAEFVAAPQWRPLGGLRILATNRRLLVWHDGAWASVWYNAIRELRPTLDVGRLDMTFEDDPPYSLAGPWVPYLSVVLTTALAMQRGIESVSSAVRVG